jgi:hypothetical protein
MGGQMGTEAYSYRRRVRGKTFLWGGPQIRETVIDAGPGIPFDIGALYLTMKNDDDGETASIGVIADPGAAEKSLGQIERGQAYTIDLRKVIGVFAVQENDRLTLISCTIHGP